MKKLIIGFIIIGIIVLSLFLLHYENVTFEQPIPHNRLNYDQPPEYITHTMKGKVYETLYGYVNDRASCYYSFFADCKTEKISLIMFDDIAEFGFSGAITIQGSYPLGTEVILELKIKKGEKGGINGD